MDWISQKAAEFTSTLNKDGREHQNVLHWPWSFSPGPASVLRALTATEIYCFSTSVWPMLALSKFCCTRQTTKTLKTTSLFVWVTHTKCHSCFYQPNQRVCFWMELFLCLDICCDFTWFLTACVLMQLRTSTVSDRFAFVAKTTTSRAVDYFVAFEIWCRWRPIYHIVEVFHVAGVYFRKGGGQLEVVVDLQLTVQMFNCFAQASTKYFVDTRTQAQGNGQRV